VGRRLGQHFLFDPTVLRRIVDALDPQPSDVVVEIGPGKGTLTAQLAQRVGRVIAIEKDQELAEELRDRCQGSGVRGQRPGVRDQGSGIGRQGLEAHVAVVHGDALRLDWHELVARHTGHPTPDPRHLIPDTRHLTPDTRHLTPDTCFKLIGNIPYYITSPLIDKALTPPLPSCIVFLVQKEVAERLAAPPGDKTYGALSVGVQAVADVEQVFTVRRGAFRPAPAVDSAVVRMTPRLERLITLDEAPAFRTFVLGLFGRRRKQIAGIVRATTGRGPEDVARVLDSLGIDATARPETLSVSTLVALFRAVQ